MTAMNQRPRILRNTTPPAENSRTIRVSDEPLVWQTTEGVTTTFKHASPPHDFPLFTNSG
jgi:hypothetical protein